MLSLFLRTTTRQSKCPCISWSGTIVDSWDCWTEKPQVSYLVVRIHVTVGAALNSWYVVNELRFMLVYTQVLCTVGL